MGGNLSGSEAKSRSDTGRLLPAEDAGCRIWPPPTGMGASGRQYGGDSRLSDVDACHVMLHEKCLAEGLAENDSKFTSESSRTQGLQKTHASPSRVSQLNPARLRSAVPIQHAEQSDATPSCLEV